jgi:hypothetical protein
MVLGILSDLSTYDPSAMFLAEAAAYFVLSLAVYAIAFYALRDRILARMNPWVGTAILLTPVLVVLVFDLGPPAFQISINAYVAASLILASFMRYGGCEVVAIPSLLFGRRYVVYCPYNVIDVVEKAVLDTILELYRELGHAPPREEVARRSRMAPERVRALLDRLAGRDLVVLEGDQIVGAYPLTDRPTEHRVRVEGQRLPCARSTRWASAPCMARTP